MNNNEKQYNVFVEGRKIQDTAKSIIQFLFSKRFEATKITLEDFVKEIQQNIWRLFGIGIQVNHEAPLNKRCEQLMEQLISNRLIMVNE
jgi:hypothetical protein